MSRRPNRENQFERYMQCRELLDASGCGNDPVYRDLMLEMASSPLQNGAKAEMAANLMGGILGPKAAANALGFGAKRRIPHFDPKDGVLFGHCVQAGAPVGVPYRAMPKHITLLGATGSGKTNAVGPVVLEQCPKDVKYHFLDIKGEASRLIRRYPDGLVVPPDKLFMNLMSTYGNPNKSLMSRFQKLAPILKILATTWPAGAQLLAQVSQSKPADEPDLSLADAIHILQEAGKKRSSKLRTLAERLQILANVLGPEISRVRSGPDILSRYRWIGYDLSDKSTMECNAIEMCREDCLTQKLSADGHSNLLTHIIVFDEVLNFLSKEIAGAKSGSGYVPYQRAAFAQLRSYGICLIVCCQYPSQAEKSVLANSDALIVMRLQEPIDARIGSSLLCGNDDLAEEIRNLKPGFAFFKSSYFPEPIRIKMPYFDLGDYPNREELERMMAPEIEWMRQNSIFSPEMESAVPDLTYAQIFPERCPTEEDDSPVPTLLAEHVAFLKAVIAKPDLSTRARYKDIGLSVGVGQRIRDALIDQNLIELVVMPSTGGCPEKRLKVTEKGEEYLDGLSEDN